MADRRVGRRAGETNAHVLSSLVLCGALIASPAAAQNAGRPPANSFLSDLSAAIETLTATVAPSVVQVVATGYRPLDDAAGRSTGLPAGRQSSIGAGAVIDSEGNIVTNAHIVADAQDVLVVLPTRVPGSGPLDTLAAAAGTTVPARVVGVASDLDLALIKVNWPGLRPLPLADYDRLRQGELVFAFGSPEGLRNSVSMGVVSAPARQADPDSAAVYIQTDAPINPGNSGGPLVNARGELVGLNTFILSDSGGSQGLGFAIPSAIIAAAYTQLKTLGHLRRGTIGLRAQAITPALADGLKLRGTAGVLVSDVVPDGPADVAGIQVTDVVTSVNGKPVDNVPTLMLALLTRQVGDTVTLGLIRGSDLLTLSMSVADRPPGIDDLNDRVDPEKNAVPRLGIVGVDVDDETAAIVPDLRIPSGVLVTALRRQTDPDEALRRGDVIHSVNGITVRSLDGLRVLLDGLDRNQQVVLQIERDHRLMFTAIVVA